MALQSFAAANSTETGQPAATNFPPPPNNNALTPGSSIPFSFLIAFIALFLFFLGCGLGTRRAAVVLRRNLGLEDPAVSGSRRKEVVRPVIWDAWPEMDQRNACEKWTTMQVSHSFSLSGLYYAVCNVDVVLPGVLRCCFRRLHSRLKPL